MGASQRRIIAIGDIHGCRDALCRLLDKLAYGAEDTLVFLGDYCDRGPDTPGVVTRLLELQAAHAHCVFLRGNHDAMLLHFLALQPAGDGDAFTLACNGGLQTLQQYGCPNELLRQCPEGRLPSDDIRRALADCICAEHREFFMATRPLHVTRHYVFAHAGINPQRTLATQTHNDLFWVREEFIAMPHTLPQVVIYGHTPTYDLDWRPRDDRENRKIGVDTGAVYGGFLTALILPQMDFVQVPGFTQEEGLKR
jgi:serine/threonine protein phosphatase 1